MEEKEDEKDKLIILLFCMHRAILLASIHYLY